MRRMPKFLLSALLAACVVIQLTAAEAPPKQWGTVVFTFKPTPETPPATPVVPPPETASPMAGSTSITAAVIDSQAATEKALNTATIDGASPFNASPETSGGFFSYYREQYTYFHSTPYLYVLGIPLGNILNDNTDGHGNKTGRGFFQPTLWAALLIFVVIAIGSKMRSGQGMMEFYSALIIKVMIAGLIYASPDLIYAACMTLQNAGRAAVLSMQTSAAATPGGVASRLSEVLSRTGPQDSQLQAARERAVRNGLSDRQGLFTRYAHNSAEDLATTDYWAHFFNRLGKAQEAYPNANRYADIPSTAQAAKDEVRAMVVQRYIDLSLESARVDPRTGREATFSIDWAYTPPVDAGSSTGATPYKVNRKSFTVKPLSESIEKNTKSVAEALAKLGSTPADQEARAKLLSQYEATIRESTSNWVDRSYIDSLAQVISGESAMSNILRDIGDQIRRAGLSVATRADVKNGALADEIIDGLSTGVTVLQKTLVPVLGLVVTFAFHVIMELSLLGVMVTLPLWFFDGTKKAFTGAIETMIACSIMLPFWMFFQLILDLVFRAMSAVMAGGAMASLVLLGPAAGAILVALALGYFVASAILAFKTPSLVKAFLSGGAWVTGVIGTAVKGIAAGALVAAAAATAGAGAAVGGSVVAGGAGGAAKGSFGGFMKSVGSGLMNKGAIGGGQSSTMGNFLGKGMRGGSSMLKHIVLNGGDSQAAFAGYTRARDEKKKKSEPVAV